MNPFNLPPIHSEKLLSSHASSQAITIHIISIVVRSLAAEVARVVNKNTWNVDNVSAGEFISAEVDNFRPELDAYLVWLVEWIHELHTGESRWSEIGVIPHTINVGDVHVIPILNNNETNEKECFPPITGGLSEFIVYSICLPNNEVWY